MMYFNIQMSYYSVPLLGVLLGKYEISSTQAVAVGSSGTPFKLGFVGNGLYEISDIYNYIQTYMYIIYIIFYWGHLLSSSFLL